MLLHRRRFLTAAAATSVGFAGLSLAGCGRPSAPEAASNALDLVPDPKGILDLPRGFSYRILTVAGDRMTDGLRTPGQPDGMAAFPFRRPDGNVDPERLVLIRNHENGEDDDEQPNSGFLGFDGDHGAFYDRVGDMPAPGGTTSLVINTRTLAVERSLLSLAGTVDNCAGGPTPWGSWVTCEETTVRAGGKLGKDHGYNFEVPAAASARVEPIPLLAMGRFEHEAIAVDPRTGIVYQTEDDSEGLITRFLPDTRGELAKGGRLQALAVKGASGLDTRNWGGNAPQIAVRETLETTWVDLDAVDNPDDDLRFRGRKAGAAIFARGEGMWFGNGEVYFACTSGGLAKQGQIWRYIPSPFEGTAREAEAPGKLELFVEPNDETVMSMCDNITVAPWGGVVVCENGPNLPQLRVVSASGNVRTFARHRAGEEEEHTGACFSPDGRILFVNAQTAGQTFAITGPWDIAFPA